jgi:hypothetical protein
MRFFTCHATARRVGFGSAMLALAAASAPAAAQDASRWECQAAYGQTAENFTIFPPGTRSVSGHIQFVSGEFGYGSQPRAAISLNGTVPPGTPHCACTGLMAFLDSDDKVQFEMHGNGNGEPFAQANLGVAITFKVFIDQSGKLLVSMGKTNAVTKTLQLDYPVERPLRLSCSGADVVFSDLRTQ